MPYAVHNRWMFSIRYFTCYEKWWNYENVMKNMKIKQGNNKLTCINIAMCENANKCSVPQILENIFILLNTSILCFHFQTDNKKWLTILSKWLNTHLMLLVVNVLSFNEI